MKTLINNREYEDELEKKGIKYIAGVDEVGQGEINDAVLTAERNGGFRHLAGQDIQAAALSAGQKHGDAFFLHGVSSPFFYVLLFFRGSKTGSDPLTGVLLPIISFIILLP